MNATTHTHRHAGFTLVELVATLVVVGILAAVAVPRMFDFQALQERGYVDEVAQSLRYAQKIAIASNCAVAVFINRNNYSVFQRPNEFTCNSPAGTWTTPVLRGDGISAAGLAPADVAMAPDNSLVIFESDGSVRNAPPLLSAGPFTITIDQASGAVMVTT